MHKSRLEAFSDGVLAIIITIMVLEIKIPHTSSWNELHHLIPILFSYLISFIYIGIYWGNHHHLLHTIKHVSAAIIWSNLHLLFWLSLIPFATGWMSENNFAPNTLAVYGTLLLCSGVAYLILQKTIESKQEKGKFEHAFKQQGRKGTISVIAYAVSIALAYVSPYLSGFIFIAVAVMWLVPDRNIEKALEDSI